MKKTQQQRKIDDKNTAVATASNVSYTKTDDMRTTAIKIKMETIS